MKMRWMLALLVALAVPVSAAQFWTYEALTVADSSIGLTDSTINPSGQQQITNCQARLETAQIRYRLDGAPTTTVGMLMEVGDVLNIESAADAKMIRFIRTGSSSGSLRVTCWRK